MILELSTVARVVGAAPPAEDATITGWSVDTRTLTPGDLFFALRGPNHDGADYAAAAIERGASGVVAERAGAKTLVVPEALAALQRLAAWAREQWGGRVIGVTGSAGKTTTKDAIAHLLGSEFAVGKTAGNWNNHVGVPLSILRLPDECRVAVLEMGMNHAGEIRALAAIARPDIGVVTNVGYAHVEAFDSIEGVALAKRELIEALNPASGIAVLNAGDPRVLRFRDVHPGPVITFGFEVGADVRAEHVALDPDGARFAVDGVEFRTHLAGWHGILNILAAIAVARAFDIPAARLQAEVAGFTIGKMRGERLEHNGVVIWNDCYNSNLEAIHAMLDVLHATPARRRIAVLGEMLELGRCSEALHQRAGRNAASSGIDVLVGIRGHARDMVEEAVRAGMPPSAVHFFEDPAEAGEFLRHLVRPGDAVLFKGSRGVAVERALEKVLA